MTHYKHLGNGSNRCGVVVSAAFDGFQEVECGRTASNYRDGMYVCRECDDECAAVEKRDADARLQRVLRLAKELCGVPCHCHECWTDRDMHDPHGCLWAEASELRDALRVLDPRTSSAQGNQEE